MLKRDGTREVHMRGLGGEMIGVYRIDWENGNQYYTKPVRLAERERVYAAGRLLFEGGKFVATDRLGSVAYKFGTGLAVQNGGFETWQVTPWVAYGGATISLSVGNGRSGNYGLRMTTPTADHGAYQDVKGLVAGMTYQFRAWVRAESGTSLAALAVCDSSYNGFVWTGVRTATTDWQQLTVTFTATGQGVARVHLAKHDTIGALLWDDVELAGGEYAISGVKMRYYPYGQEVGTATANDVAKFGTYTRDASSGLDYAMNRYYMSTWGRFTTADPYRASGGPGDPGSWNRYAYVQGDPVNLYDPMGLQADRPKIITPPVTVVDSVTYLDTVMEFYNAEFGGFNGWTGGGGGNRVGAETPTGGGGAGNNATPQLPQQPTKTQERLERLKDCAVGYYGLDSLSLRGLSSGAIWGLIAASAGGIPKAIPEGLGLVRTIRQPGSSSYTSLLSILSAASGERGNLRTVANFGSKWAGPIGIASALIDVTAIGICAGMD